MVRIEREQLQRSLIMYFNCVILPVHQVLAKAQAILIDLKDQTKDIT